MEAHAERVAAVAAAVKARPEGQKLSIRKATAAHQIHNRLWKQSCHRVDVSPLSNILGFEDGVELLGTPCKLAVCEGQVTMAQLVKASLAIGYVPYVVPEFPDFTVAGLINGDGIQSSSFKWGLFTHCVVEMELVLGNGEVVVANSQQHSDLFKRMQGSYGSLAIVTRATVCLRPALPLVRSEYCVYRTLHQFIVGFDAAVRAQQGHFLEGIVLAEDCYVMVRSAFTATADGLPLFDPAPFDLEKGERYYYQYMREAVHSGLKTAAAAATTTEGMVIAHRDVIPAEGFVFRSFRGLYWTLESYINLRLLTNQSWFRRICDKEVARKMLHCGLEAGGHLNAEEVQRCFVNQDMGIFLHRLEEGIAYVQKNFAVYPLWICPVNVDRSSKPYKDYIVDIGIYGEPTVKPFYHRKAVKAVQEFVDSPSKWGVCYLDKETVRLEWHDIREKYHALDAFVGVEEKTSFRPPDENMEELPIPNWRLVDQYGWYWWVKVPAALVTTAACLTLVGALLVKGVGLMLPS